MSALLAATAYAAFDELRARFELVVAEGAASPAEVNLRSSDHVNLDALLALARKGVPK